MSLWADPEFLWDPAPDADQSMNLVTGEGSDTTLTEGTVVTHRGLSGRSYSGAVGSRFTVPSNLSALDPDAEWTMFCSVRLPSASQDLWALAVANGGDNEQYAMIRARNATTGEMDARIDSSSRSDSAWPATNPASLSGNTEIVTYVSRFTNTGTNTATLEAYIDSTTAFGSDTANTTNTLAPTRITIGRLERSSQVNSTGGEVYAAGIWSRAISNGELSVLIDNPFLYLKKRHVYANLATTNTVTARRVRPFSYT